MLERILVGVGAVLPISLFLCGLYFFWRCGAALCRHPKRVLRAVLLQDQTGTSPWRALSVALAGTLGVGNIAGVATAISFGGAGAVFWMLVAAFFAMPIKYAEIVLAQSTARRDAALCLHGGATYYIRKAFGGGTGRVLAVVFALLLLFSTFTLGTMLQAAAATQALAAAFAAQGCEAIACAEPRKALALARELAGADGTVLAAGSLYLIGALRAILREEREFCDVV